MKMKPILPPLSPITHSHQVLVVLSGCPSDADCVALASRFALHSLVSITIMLMPAAQVFIPKFLKTLSYDTSTDQPTINHKPQEQSGKYADFLKDFGPGGRFTNVRLLRLEPYDADLKPRSHDSLIKVRPFHSSPSAAC
jgi:hypothetical protein